jgi:transposase, IS5 family
MQAHIRVEGPFSSPYRGLEAAMAVQSGLFDVDDRLRRLSDLGDQLEVFAAAVDFEIFRPELERRSPIPTAPRAAGNRLIR